MEVYLSQQGANMPEQGSWTCSASAAVQVLVLVAAISLPLLWTTALHRRTPPLPTPAMVAAAANTPTASVEKRALLPSGPENGDRSSGLFGAVDAGPGHFRLAPGGKVRVSATVAAGLLLGEIKPVYPPSILAARVGGAVLLLATIDRTGRVIEERVISGPVILRGAVVDAVKRARYRPFLLNGEPTEFETTIVVNFRRES